MSFSVSGNKSQSSTYCKRALVKYSFVANEKVSDKGGFP